MIRIRKSGGPLLKGSTRRKLGSAHTLDLILSAIHMIMPIIPIDGRQCLEAIDGELKVCVSGSLDTVTRQPS